MTAQTQSVPGRISGTGFGLALAAIALAAWALQSIGPLNHDVAWILTGSGWILDGASLGADIIDPNPPLPWWLAAVPLGLGRLAGVGPAPAFIAFTIIACIAGLLLMRAALARSGSPLAGSNGFQLFAAAAILLAPGYDFGQREHYLLIASLPWLAAADAAARGRRLPGWIAAGIGLFSAIGFCLKPYFLIVPIAAELWVAWRTRRIAIRPEALALAGFGLFYLAAVFLWAPDYLSHALPDARGSYWAFDEPFATVAARIGVAFLPLLAAAFLLLRGASAEARSAAAIFFVGALAAAAIALIQFKGWPYHLLPGTALAAIGCAALARSGRRALPVAAAALLLVLFGAFAGSFGYARSIAAAEPPVSARLAERFRREAGPGGTVFAFIPSPRDVHPAIVASGVRWPSPYCCLYLLPAWVRADEAPERAPAARAAALRQLDIVLTRLEARPPALIAVADGAFKLGFGGRRFDYLDFLSRYPRFRRLMGLYAEQERIGDYRIFVRRPGG